jgi:hypothetical protein
MKNPGKVAALLAATAVVGASAAVAAPAQKAEALPIFDYVVACSSKGGMWVDSPFAHPEFVNPCDSAERLVYRAKVPAGKALYFRKNNILTHLRMDRRGKSTAAWYYFTGSDWVGVAILKD